MNACYKAIRGIRVTAFFAVVFLYLLLVHGAGPARAANPTSINFQGKVVNADGTNVTNGSYTFIFRLYDIASPTTSTACASDTHCWWEETDSITVTNGVFQVSLGSTCAFASACNSGHSGINFNTNNTLYLTMKFNSDAAGFMSPTVALSSVPYAFNADNLNGLSASSFGQLSANNTWTGTNLVRTASATAFQVQNGSNNSVLTVDTSGNQVVLGKAGASGLTGVLAFDNAAGPNTISLSAQASNPTSSATLFLPLAGATGVQCLQSTSGSTSTSTTLQFGSCSGGTPTVASVYAGGSSQTDSTITLDSTRLGLIVMDASTPISGSLLTVQNSGGTTKYLDISSGAFNVQAGTTLSLLSGGTNAATFDSGTTGNVNIGTGGNAKTTTIGSTNTTSTTTIQSGSGNINLSPAVGSDVVYSQGAGSQLLLTASAATTADQLVVSNASGATSTTGVNGLSVNFNTTGTTNSADNSGLRIDVTSGDNGTATTLEGLKIGNLTTPEANATETGLYVGTGWDIGLDVQSGGLQLAALSSNPPTPASGDLRVYAKTIAGRTMLKSMGSSGVDYALQPSLFQQSVFLETPGTGATTTTYSATGGSTTSVGTLNAAIGGVTEAQGFMANIATGTTAGNTAGTGNNVAQYFRGSVSNGADGFFYFTRISLPDALAKYANSTTGSRLWFGLTDQSNATMVGSDNPAGNYAGIQFSGVRDTAPADFKFITKNNTTQHVTDTGVLLAVSKTYDIYIYCAFQCTSVNWRIDNLTDGTAPVEGTETNDLPTATTAMRSGIQIATLEAVAHNLRFQRIYVETDR